MPSKKKAGSTPVEAITHDDKRANLPTADAHEFVDPEMEEPKELLYPRDPSLDPQLVWKGKDELDQSDLEVDAPPIYIQEKIDPRVLIENLRKTAKAGEDEPELTLFDTFDGLDDLSLVEFYEHEANWSNRMVLGDSLQVMASLAGREALGGKVQMIYVDPPYGIDFKSNWQPRLGQREVRDGKLEHATREAEQIRAFRDLWELGIHSYLTYLRDRLTVAKDLLVKSGSIVVQISDDNLHLVRAVLDEIFGRENYAGQIAFLKTSSQSTATIQSIFDILLVYAKDIGSLKYRSLLRPKVPGDEGAKQYTKVYSPGLTDYRSMTPAELADPSLVPDG